MAGDMLLHARDGAAKHDKYFQDAYSQATNIEKRCRNDTQRSTLYLKLGETAVDVIFLGKHHSDGGASYNAKYSFGRRQCSRDR
jgi:hypothetical protein